MNSTLCASPPISMPPASFIQSAQIAQPSRPGLPHAATAPVSGARKPILTIFSCANASLGMPALVMRAAPATPVMNALRSSLDVTLKLIDPPLAQAWNVSCRSSAWSAADPSRNLGWLCKRGQYQSVCGDTKWSSFGSPKGASVCGRCPNYDALNAERSRRMLDVLCMAGPQGSDRSWSLMST